MPDAIFDSDKTETTQNSRNVTKTEFHFIEELKSFGASFLDM